MCGNCPLWLALGAAPETEAEAVGVTRGVGGVCAAGGWRGRRKFSGWRKKAPMGVEG